MQSSITVNGTRLYMDGLRALMVGTLIEQIVRAGDIRELRLAGRASDGTEIRLIALITPSTGYAVRLDTSEQDIQDILAGEMREHLEDNFDVLSDEYGLRGATTQKSRDLH